MEASPIALDFKQKSAGTYEAEFKADEAGSYFLNATAKQTVEEMKDGKKVFTEKTIDGVRSGVTIPYSPEFADVETNTLTHTITKQVILKSALQATGEEANNIPRTNKTQNRPMRQHLNTAISFYSAKHGPAFL